MNDTLSTATPSGSAQILLEIVTPDSRLFRGYATLVELPTIMGEIGIYPGHICLFTQLTAGEVRAYGPNGMQTFLVAGGHAQIEPDSIHLLALFASPEDDKTKVEEACKRAESALEFAGSLPPEQIEDNMAMIRLKLEQKQSTPSPQKKWR